MFTRGQKEAIKRSNIKLHFLLEKEMQEIVRHPLYVSNLTEEKLVEFLRVANALYRAGEPIISDADYDFVYLAELKRRNPEHDYLTNVEPESAFEGVKRDLPVLMLSTDKAYSRTEIERWLERIEKSAVEIGIDPQTLIIHATPKLDGFAAYDDGKHLMTRGTGKKGTDISRVFERGLAVLGEKRGSGVGEIVIDKDYFETYLTNHFENTRNVQSSIIKEKKLDPYVEEAIKEKAVVFCPFSELPSWDGHIEEVRKHFEEIVAKAWNSVNYDVDGVILEVKDERIKNYMGATSHHYRWQIAYKANVEKASVEVINVIPQTSRSGRVTPVAELKPTKLSGATISRATAHNYAMVKKKGIGPGAVVELVRSGMVIPKIERVIKKADTNIPDKCPSCHSPLVWDSDNLICTNVGHCPAQITNTIEHFFKTIGNIDGFGTATIEKLYENNKRSIYDIYRLRDDDFKGFGFGDKQSQNLVSELERSRKEPIEDWRFLAAFGVHRLGIASSERLLQYIRFEDVFDTTVEKLIANKIFAKRTDEIVVDGLGKIKHEFERVRDLSFNLQRTKLIAELRQEGMISPITGKQIIFTGTMKHGSREEMERAARILGAKIAASVSGRTDLLVTGEDVGVKKLEAATRKRVKVISENDYLELIKEYVDRKQ